MVYMCTAAWCKCCCCTYHPIIGSVKTSEKLDNEVLHFTTWLGWMYCIFQSCVSMSKLGMGCTNWGHITCSYSPHNNIPRHTSNMLLLGYNMKLIGGGFEDGHIQLLCVHGWRGCRDLLALHTRDAAVHLLSTPYWKTHLHACTALQCPSSCIHGRVYAITCHHMPTLPVKLPTRPSYAQIHHVNLPKNIRSSSLFLPWYCLCLLLPCKSCSSLGAR